MLHPSWNLSYSCNHLHNTQPHVLCSPCVWNRCRVRIFPLIKVILIKHIFRTGYWSVVLAGAMSIPTDSVDKPATPWTWASDVEKYFAVLRGAVGRVPVCWNDTVPGSPRISTLLSEDATTIPLVSCFPHPVHLSSPGFGGWYFNHI